VFQKKVENFICEKCGARNIGSGYTNHCKECLWSKHVDETPGDRVSPCHGMMEPTSIEQKSGEFMIVHRCNACGKTIRNKIVPDDNRDVLASISQIFPKK